MATTAHHRVVIVGGGSAGISVAARLSRKLDDVALIEPSEQHYYQPFWTLVGAGCVEREKSRRAETSVMPRNVTWIKDAASGFEPDENRVLTEGGKTIEYDALVVCPGIQLDWDRVPGVSQAVGHDGVSSNYTYELAPKTWEFIRRTRSGTALFTMPSGPIKCAGAPQKIAYLACDHWRKEGVLDDIDVHLVVPTPRIFGIPAIAESLEAVIADYGITLHTEAELESLDADSKKAAFKPMEADGDAFTLPYDVLHVVPHQSAPDWVKASPLSTGDELGYVDVDKHTMQHVRYPNVFALGDAGSTPNSKTGAAIRKQAPVVAANLMGQLDGADPSAQYGGYASCPITTSSSHMLLAEFDYTMEPTPSFPIIDTTKPRREMWYLKKYGLPFLYWNLMLKGRA